MLTLPRKCVFSDPWKPFNLAFPLSMPQNAAAPFQLGVNYPWLRYGEDFGRFGDHHNGVSLSSNQRTLSHDFAAMRDCGISVVRWFLFADGRAGFLTKNGIPSGPDPLLFEDVATALHLAQAAALKLCFVLLDYLWLQKSRKRSRFNPHSAILRSSSGRQAFLESVLIPLFREFRSHPALHAWDVANEPEWAIRDFHPIPVSNMRLSEFLPFAKQIVSAVREYAKIPATLGSARLAWVRTWTQLDLDLLQAHYYPPAIIRREASLARQLLSLADLGKPLWLGELPAHFPSKRSYSLEDSLTVCHRAGLCGAAVWRWTRPGPDGTDQHIGRVEPAVLKSWLAAGSRPTSQA